MADTESLYWSDLPEWSAQQAAALRALAARPDLPNALDLQHLIEEVESLGKSEVSAVASAIALIFEHLIKLHARPGSLSARPWEAEILAFHGNLLDRYAPSMRRGLDLDALWQRAVALARRRAPDGLARLPLAEHCPVPLDLLIAREIDIQAALAALAAAR